MKGDDSYYPIKGFEEGITVRDHIAIQAMQAIIIRLGSLPSDTTESAYRYADAMIKQSQVK